MKTTLLPWFLLTLTSPIAAQRDAPVWEAYLASTRIQHGKADTLDLDLLFKKEGGPHEHVQHQMYVLAYLRANEARVMKIVRDRKLLDKKAKGPQFLDVLRKQKLAVVLDTKVAKRGVFTQQDMGGKYRDGSDQSESALKRNSFAFRFELKKQAILDAAAKLDGFKKANVMKEQKSTYYESAVKFLVFVPVNDSKYATKIPEKLRGMYDFTNYDWESELDEQVSSQLYCKPLSFAVRFKKYKDRLLAYIN